MDEIEIRQCIYFFRDVLNLIEAGYPIPLDFLKKQVSKWEEMTVPGKKVPITESKLLQKMH